MPLTQPRRTLPRGESASLTDSVADTIRQQLIQGQLRAGQRLSEAALAQQLDISRNTLREAFRVLAEQGEGLGVRLAIALA